MPTRTTTPDSTVPDPITLDSTVPDFQVKSVKAAITILESLFAVDHDKGPDRAYRRTVAASEANTMVYLG